MAKILKRSKTCICRYAGKMGLTNYSHPSPWSVSNEHMKNYIKEHGHPKGMLGKRQTDKCREAVSEAGKKRWSAMTMEQKDDFCLKRRKAYFGAPHPRPHTTWKGGWRTIGERRIFFRSRWEHNYACYLEWMKSLKQVILWEHEPKTFWFEGIKRGCVSYLPDFRVVLASGKEEWHEVKGWMDDRSKTKIERMGRYFPDVSLVVIDTKKYRALKKAVSFIVPGWEKE